MRQQLLVLSLLTFNFFQAQNLIQNNGFEYSPSDPSFKWEVLNGQIEQDRNVFIEGGNSAKFVTKSPNQNTLPYAWVTQDFVLNNTDEYTLKFKYFVPGNLATNSITRVGYDLVNQENMNAFFFPQIKDVNLVFGSWQTFSTTFKVLLFRDGATSVKIKLYLTANSQLSDQIVYFDDVQIVKTNNLSNNEEKFENVSNFWPNPVTDELNFKMEGVSTLDQIIISDQLGKVVVKVENSNTINVSNLAKGVYFAETLYQGKKITKKIIKE